MPSLVELICFIVPLVQIFVSMKEGCIMQKRKLGNSSIHISEISLGCMSLPSSVQEAKPIINMAIDNGINYFDTADLYDRGVNEEIVGELVKNHRQNIILATKVGNRWYEENNNWYWDPSPAHIEKGLKESLKRLKTDYVDVYQLHGGTKDDPWDDIIDTFERLKEAGYIREYGISSIRPNVFIPFLQNSSAISNMMQYSLLDRRPEEWFESIDKSSASIVTRGSIAKGLLTNEWSQRLEKTNGYMNYTKEDVNKMLTRLQEEYSNIHALSIAFNLSHSQVSSTVIGARTREQLLSSLKAYEDGKRIQDFSYVDDVTKQERYSEHR